MRNWKPVEKVANDCCGEPWVKVNSNPDVNVDYDDANENGDDADDDDDENADDADDEDDGAGDVCDDDNHAMLLCN